MNRRTFLKLTGATAVLATTPLTFAEKKETPQWTRLADQLPDIKQKVVMCEVSRLKHDIYTTTWYGIVEKNGVKEMSGYKNLPYSMIKYEHYDRYHSNKFIKRWSPGRNDRLCFFANDTSSRYWLPVEGEFPKTLPPFPIYVHHSPHASKWISFTDQMPPINEEIEVRDQTALIAKGWYIKSKTCNYFMPCETDRAWLHVNMVTVNKLMWTWRYV